MTSERLQKVLAAAGLGSRRSCESIIEEGRVTVNGKKATLGMSADPAVDNIRMDGRPLPVSEPLRTFALYKPRGVVSSLDPQGNRSTVRDLLPVEGRYFPVGRLDLDSEGLILLTNDGDLAQRISHPRYEVEKEYRVLVARRPGAEQLQIWRRGVVLADDVRTAPMQVTVEATEGKGAWLRVVMHEGRKHEIREIGLRIGLPVVRIIRRRIGDLLVGNLRPGLWRELTAVELALFTRAAAKRAAAPRRSPRRRTGGRVAGKRAPDPRTPSQQRGSGRDAGNREPASGRPSQQRGSGRDAGNREPASGRPSQQRGGGRDAGNREPAPGRPSQQRGGGRDAGNREPASGRPSQQRGGGRDDRKRAPDPRTPPQQRGSGRDAGKPAFGRRKPTSRRGSKSAWKPTKRG